MNRLDRCLEIARTFYPRKRVLDIGGGGGEFAKLLAIELNAEFEVLDKTRGQDIKTLFIYPDRSYDFIFAGNMIDILPDPDFLLRAIQRLLTDRGVALLTFPQLDFWLNRIAVLFGFQPYGDRPSTEYNVGKMFIKPDKFSEKNAGYFHHFSRRAFKQLATIYGFKVHFYTNSLERFAICRLSLR